MKTTELFLGCFWQYLLGKKNLLITLESSVHIRWSLALTQPSSKYDPHPLWESSIFIANIWFQIPADSLCPLRHYLLIYFILFIWVLTSLSTFYRSYYNGEFNGQRKPVHTIGHGSVLYTAYRRDTTTD